jgi:peptide/nickel transport system ATP-binding protein
MPALVEIKGLKKYFDTPRGQLHAVDDVTMAFNSGTTMGVVGESGCGKSTLGRTIIHLQESSGGQIFYNGKDVTHVKSRQLAELRRQMQIVFQDPYSSLNPRYTVEETFKEPLLLSGRATKKSLGSEIRKLMDLVGIAGRLRRAYPHEMDGGRRQRVGIGRALAMNPSFIVCDEPVSALDVSIQAQVINLLLDLQRDIGLTYMFVTHDLSVVRYISDNISVMYLGQLVETSASDELFEKPLHPYTTALLSAIPSIDIRRKKERVILRGEITSPINPLPGCRFTARCPYVAEGCHEPQQLNEILPGHFVSCCRVLEINHIERDKEH